MLLSAIVRAALRYRLVVVLLVGGLAAIQIARLPGARYDVFPEFTAPTVLIETATPGFSALQTEQLVTDRLERRLTGLPGLARMRSTSEAGLSVVHLVFHGGTDPFGDRQRVAGRLAELGGALPAGIVPRLAPMQSSTGTALEIGLYPTGHMSLERLTAIAETEVRPALLAVPGVANIVMFGARPPQFDVAVRPRRLLATGFTLAAVARAAHAASAVLGAGFIDSGAQRLVLAPEGQARNAAALAASWLGARDGVPVSLGDVAHVRIAAPPRFGAALIHDRQGLLLLVSSLYGANTLKVANQAAHVIARLTPGLRAEGVGVDPRAFTPAAFIRVALLDLGHVLLIGAALILLVLLVALRDWRAALISFVAIPVSLLAAVGVITALGITLNTMALAGLAIALGELVDDAVVDVENITRRLRENRAAAAPAPRLLVILRASLEVRSAIVFASAAVVVAFTPVIALGGVAGRLFAPLGIAYIAAIAASLMVALVVTPALAALLLGRGDDGRAHTPPIVLLQPAYRRALAGLERWGRLAAVLAVAVAAVAAPVTVSVYGPNLARIDVAAQRIAAAARHLPGVRAASLAATQAEPTLSVTLDRAAMLRYGVTARAALAALRIAYAGTVVGHVYRGTLVEPVVVTLPKALRREPASVGDLPVAASGGMVVPLRRIAQIGQTRGPAQILHDDGRRVQVVTVQTAHGRSAAVVAALRRRIAGLGLGAGIYVQYGGTAIAGGAARRSLVVHAGMALGVILALIALALRDARAVALIVGILPVAFAGGVAAVWIFLAGHLGLGAMVGLATLFGLTLRNGLLLLIHMRRLVLEHGMDWSAATARAAAADRLPAIVITASVTALGLLPLAIAAGSPGDAIEGPMAIVILGGLLTATLLSLFVLPVLAPRLARFRPPADDGLG